MSLSKIEEKYFELVDANAIYNELSDKAKEAFWKYTIEAFIDEYIVDVNIASRDALIECTKKSDISIQEIMEDYDSILPSEGWEARDEDNYQDRDSLIEDFIECIDRDSGITIELTESLFID